ncbi:hypothetical protein MDAP_002575 [Mitosporidium daphniae]
MDTVFFLEGEVSFESIGNKLWSVLLQYFFTIVQYWHLPFIFSLPYIFVLFQRFFICKPSKNKARINEEYKLETIKTKDGATFQGIWKNDSEASDGILVYFHGNSDNCYSYLYMADAFCKHLDVSHVFIPDYRSFGESNTFLRPSDKQIEVDAEAAFSHAMDKRKDFNLQDCPIYLYGHSLGAYPALYLASKHPEITSVTIANPFYNLRSLVYTAAPFLLKWSFLLIYDTYPNNNLCKSLSKMSENNIRILILASKKDELVNYSRHAEKLFDILAKKNIDPEIYKIHVFESGSHNQMYKEEGFFLEFEGFIPTKKDSSSFSIRRNQL